MHNAMVQRATASKVLRIQECSYVPTNDPTLEVEWSMDGKPLSNSSRMKVISDFGFAMLDISSADSRDSGKYTCAIRNRSNTQLTSSHSEWNLHPVSWDFQIWPGRHEQPTEVPGIERRLLRAPQDEHAPKDRAETKIRNDG